MNTDPHLSLNYGWEFGESGWNVGMDNNLIKLGAVVHLSVLSDSLTTPPSSPVEGDRYIVAQGSLDEWLNHEREIAMWIGSEWKFYTPQEGWLCWVYSRKVLTVLTDDVWEDLLAL